MPQAVYVQDDDYMDYTPVAAVAAGDVILQGDLIGVAVRPIPAGTPGALALEGIFDAAKATNVAYTVGTILYWDNTNQIVTATATGNKLFGKAVKAAATADSTVRVRLNP